MKKVFFAFVFLIVSAVCFAQSANVISEIIESPKASIGQVSYLCGVSIGIINENVSYNVAVDTFKKVGILPRDVSADDVVSVEKFALLALNTWQVKPCLMYKIFPSAHYALRSLKGAQVIDFAVDPKKEMSGNEVLFLITECIDKFEPYNVSNFYK